MILKANRKLAKQRLPESWLVFPALLCSISCFRDHQLMRGNSFHSLMAREATSYPSRPLSDPLNHDTGPPQRRPDLPAVFRKDRALFSRGCLVCCSYLWGVTALGAVWMLTYHALLFLSGLLIYNRKSHTDTPYRTDMYIFWRKTTV